MLRLFGFLKPHKGLLIALIIVNVLLSGMLTIAPLVTKAIVDDVIDGQQLDLLLPYLGFLLVVTAVRAATTYFYSYGQNKMGQLVMSDVRGALYRKLLALPYNFYDREQTGRLMSRVSSDVESTRIFLSQILIESMSHMLTIILSFIAFLQQDVQLALFAIIPVLMSGVGMFWAHRAMRQPWTKQHDLLAKLSATLQDSLSGIKVVKAFAQEDQARWASLMCATGCAPGQPGHQRRLVQTLGDHRQPAPLYAVGADSGRRLPRDGWRDQPGHAGGHAQLEPAAAGRSQCAGHAIQRL